MDLPVMKYLAESMRNTADALLETMRDGKTFVCDECFGGNFEQVLFVTDTLQEKIKTVAQRHHKRKIIEKITQDAHDTQAWLKSSGRIGRRKR